MLILSLTCFFVSNIIRLTIFWLCSGSSNCVIPDSLNFNGSQCPSKFHMNSLPLKYFQVFSSITNLFIPKLQQYLDLSFLNMIFSASFCHFPQIVLILKCLLLGHLHGSVSRLDLRVVSEVLCWMERWLKNKIFQKE